VSTRLAQAEFLLQNVAVGFYCAAPGRSIVRGPCSKVTMKNHAILEVFMAAQARGRSVAVSIGPVKVCGSNPIVVQSMNQHRHTADVSSTGSGDGARTAGSELVRVTSMTESFAQRSEYRRHAWIIFACAFPSSAISHYTVTCSQNILTWRARSPNIASIQERQYLQETRRHFRVMI